MERHGNNLLFGLITSHFSFFLVLNVYFFISHWFVFMPFCYKKMAEQCALEQKFKVICALDGAEKGGWLCKAALLSVLSG